MQIPWRAEAHIICVQFQKRLLKADLVSYVLYIQYTIYTTAYTVFIVNSASEVLHDTLGPHRQCVDDFVA